jgi:hypothetical protein
MTHGVTRKAADGLLALVQADGKALCKNARIEAVGPWPYFAYISKA